MKHDHMLIYYCKSYSVGSSISFHLFKPHQTWFFARIKELQCWIIRDLHLVKSRAYFYLLWGQNGFLSRQSKKPTVNMDSQRKLSLRLSTGIHRNIFLGVPKMKISLFHNLLKSFLLGQRSLAVLQIRSVIIK